MFVITGHERQEQYEWAAKKLYQRCGICWCIKFEMVRREEGRRLSSITVVMPPRNLNWKESLISHTALSRKPP